VGNIYQAMKILAHGTLRPKGPIPALGYQAVKSNRRFFREAQGFFNNEVKVSHHQARVLNRKDSRHSAMHKWTGIVREAITDRS